MSFSIQSVTDAGHEAIQIALDGGYALTFTAIKAGNGLYTDGEDVTGMTELKSLKNAYAIGSKESDQDGVTLGAVIVNYDGSQTIVSESYKVNEIGLYCTVNGTEYLYAVAAVPNDGGRELPGYDGNNLTQIVQRWYVAYTNDLEIQVDMTGAFALALDLQAEIEKRQQLEDMLISGNVKAEVTDTDGNILTDSDGNILEAKWKLAVI